METIYALSTAAGRAGIAVLRLSGPHARPALEALTGGKASVPREAMLVRFRDPETQAPLDRGLAIFFPAPASFTGEDVVELHIHGGRAVVAAMLRALGQLPGLRAAKPGEFTRRAFENGKLDLTEVEGLADLIDAETEAQRAQALRQMEGALGQLYEGWRARLMRALAYAEAEIDFPDEEVPGDLIARLGPEIAALESEIGVHLDDGRRGERLRDGVEVAIVGPPNAGKSSLLNRLAGRDAAIVSDEAGTTRDVLEVRLDIGGVPVTLADTAGLREAAGAIEQEGVRRALARAEAADLRIVMVAPGAAGIGDGFALARPDDLRVLNKVDLGAAVPAGVIGISALTGQGIDALEAALAARVGSAYEAREHPVITRARHREGLGDCAASLARAGAALKAGRDAELVAEDLRLAARALGRLTGRVDVEDLLDVIFRDFCIGK
ncbi:tRNA uridine-5-carboxymethylaminomethyl(34) synthesis GTPase MnmE [Parvibaculum sp.]|uniref:tRNA uridine-5-carboxymethylaminomethyl(34) synthesis GTPase MnmE n=1 Tax=Parvibaculum sp. TaxID=2024848 RepID=UPI0027305DA5|nr:tRNA uridine-5-carboxymethylaminomethyl(34) synthesis GTPase MnmE [Parvibaculum sp.]MDP1625957.1 tRNA uridine-5-carboxymethylaminomethyl(34) synthesis GTPase MnmE [Parvibaculum sp.]MDP2149662.1 tRNA uridine-5-carboxymethylaminomethyl(34) synthesis GTPase MnmE [Parvibaculum sp.]MDP3329596.1 tRNA uridine-5-carboxymethylaminomethyl(34) synthesis GTPase MnmE [Parvibaculum sp.]